MVASLPFPHTEGDWTYLFKYDKGTYFFTQSIVKLWNMLPQEVVMGANLGHF